VPSVNISKLNIRAIPAFNDNYIWCLISPDTQSAVLVDPGDEKPCIEFLQANQLTLTDIIVTHHHWDHTDGIKPLLSHFENKGQKINVYGPKDGKFKEIDIALSEGDDIFIKSLNLSLNIIEIPGHTLDHIAYYTDDFVFCGDTLFSGGCGRIFEGTPSQMLSSLEKLSALPDKTLVFCTHEYTLANLNFALKAEPNNQILQEYTQEIKALRNDHLATLPTSIGIEKAINPFLRSDQQTIAKQASEYCGKVCGSKLDTFTAIREWKNNF